MKNFTNNFKQFTSRLSARWLIMAFMMLVGTSSAWAVDIYITTTATNKINIHTWNNSCGNTSWPGQTIIESPSTNENGGFYIYTCSKDDNYNYILNNGSGGQTGDLTIKSTSWGVYNGSNTFDVLMTESNMASKSITFCSDALNGWTTNTSTTWDATKKKYKTAEVNYSKQSGIDVYIAGTKFIYKAPSTFGSPSTGTYIIYWDPYTSNFTFENPCTPSATLSSAVYDAENNEIDLSGSIETCDNNLFYGFLWKNKNDANWNTANAISGTGGSNNNTTEDIDFNQSWDDFTPGDTYEFTAYALDATTNPYTWYYSTNENDVLEVETCTSIPENAYAIAGNNEWTGNENPVTINYDANTYGTPTIYYDGKTQVPIAVGKYTITIDVPSNGTYCPATDLEIGTFTITCPTIAAPTITTSATVCAGTQVTLSNYNGVNENTVKWYSDEECNSEVTEQVTITDNDTKYYAKAYHAASGCSSSEYSTLAFTVNPLPTINIGEDVTAVKFEDVVLTATGNNIADVTWIADKGTITKDATDPKKAVLTYDQTGDVIVTATATSVASCTSTAATKTVTFSAEDCTPVPSNDIKITFTHPAKNNNNASCQYWGFGYIFKDGVTPNNDRTNYLAVFPNKDQTSGSKTVTLSNVQTAEIKVYLNAYYEYSSCRASTQVFTLQRGGIYSITISSDQQGNGNWEKVPSVTKTGSLTQDPPITAPAVKMVSAKYNETTDKIDAVAAVYKRGCANVEWGFQYSDDGITWSDKIHPNSHTATAVGEVTHSFSIDGGDGNTYYIRAYAKNSNSEVTSANTKSVEIPSSIIESATISLVDSEGEDSDVTEVCPQSTVYLKVSYVGGDFKDYEAADDFPGTNLELVNHDKAKNEAIFSYTATATGVANITISNDNTSITTTNGVSITLKNVTPVNAPMISISQGTICEGGSATITVNNPIANLTYTLYKETEPIGNLVNYQTDDLTEAGSYTVRAEESICHNYANSMPVELKVVTSDVKIGLAVDKTTVNPWQPLKLTVTPPEGYAYSIDGLADVVYTQSGDVYTIKIPRPNAWSPGNSGDPVKTMPITFSAKIQVTDDLTCGTSSVNVTLADTEENCK